MAVAWNPLDKDSGLVVSNGDRTVDSTTSSWQYIRSTHNTPLQYGYKYYWEIVIDDINPTLGDSMGIGVMAIDSLSMGCGCYTGTYDDTVSFMNYTADVRNDNSVIQTYTGYGLNDIVQIAVDPDTNSVWFGVNDVWNGDPGAGTGAAISGVDGDLVPMFSCNSSLSLITANFRVNHLTYSPPSGFVSIEYAITGSVLVNGSGEARSCRAYNYITGQLEGMVDSESTGDYDITLYTPDTCYVVMVEDNSQLYRSVVRDFVTPVERYVAS